MNSVQSKPSRMQFLHNGHSLSSAGCEVSTQAWAAKKEGAWPGMQMALQCNDIAARNSCRGYHEQADNTGERHDGAEMHGPTSPGGQGIQPCGAKSGGADEGAHSNLATLLLQLQLLA